MYSSSLFVLCFIYVYLVWGCYKCDCNNGLFFWFFYFSYGELLGWRRVIIKQCIHPLCFLYFLFFFSFFLLFLSLTLSPLHYSFFTLLYFFSLALTLILILFVLVLVFSLTLSHSLSQSVSLSLWTLSLWTLFCFLCCEKNQENQKKGTANQKKFSFFSEFHIFHNHSFFRFLFDLL